MFNYVICPTWLLHFVGHGKDYSSMLVPVTFTNTNTKVLSVIPVYQDKIVENIEIFDLSIDIPSSVRHRISLGRQRKAIASIIDSTSKFLSLLVHKHILFVYCSNQLSSKFQINCNAKSNFQ